LARPVSARHLFPSPAAAVGRSSLQPAKQPAVAQPLPTVAAAQHGLLAHFRSQPGFALAAVTDCWGPAVITDLEYPGRTRPRVRPAAASRATWIALARTTRRFPLGYLKSRRTPRPPHPCPSRPKLCALPPPGTLATATVGPSPSSLPRRREVVQEPRKEVRSSPAPFVIVPVLRSTWEPSPEFSAAVLSRAAMMCACSATCPPQPLP
jgi:hypothetical protein